MKNLVEFPLFASARESLLQSNAFSGFKVKLVANFVGTGWSAALQIICIPLYIRFMGIESYGLIGFYLMLQAILQILDFGLSPTVNREMARYSVRPEKLDEARDLVRTLETAYWLTGLVIGMTLLATSAWLAKHWIPSSSIPNYTVTRALLLMAILSVFQWPVSFYQGALVGLHRQVLYNIIRVLIVSISTAGGVLILWLVSPTITAFLAWQAAISALQVLLLWIVLWRCLQPSSRLPRFVPSMVRHVWRFAAGIGGITVFSLILSQTDKIVLSKLFSLRIFGYYALAGTLGSGLTMMTAVMSNTIYPRFSALVELADEDALCRLYHRATQLMALMVMPVAAVLAFFSIEVLHLWTGNYDIAIHAGPIATVLVIGSALNALMYLPYTLQIAYGWTSIGLKITVSLTIVSVPMLWFMAKRYGPIGAAFVWLFLNVVNMLVAVPLTHRRVLRRQMPRWFLRMSFRHYWVLY